MDTSIRLQGVLTLLNQYDLDVSHSNQVRRLSETVFKQLRHLAICRSEEPIYLIAGALLHDIGRCINPDLHEIHSQALILKHGIDGFSNAEVEAIACIARYHRLSNQNPQNTGLAALPADWQKTVRIAAGIIRIADGLDDGHRGAVKKVKIDLIGPMVQFNLTGGEIEAEIKAAEMKKDLFEHTFQLHCKFIAFKRAETSNLGSRA